MVLADVKHRFSRDEGRRRLDIDLGPHSRSAVHLVAAKSALDIPRVRAVAELLAQALREARA